jgi:hypothetical protein
MCCSGPASVPSNLTLSGRALMEGWEPVVCTGRLELGGLSLEEQLFESAENGVARVTRVPGSG